MAPLRERILAKIRIEDRGHSTPCWIWQGHTNETGYPRARLRGRRGPLERVHRVAYAEFVGPIGDGLVIDHLCRVRQCCNPVHLEPVTNAENLRRGSGFIIEGKRGAKGTHCLHGHEFTPETTLTHRTRGRAHRRCAICVRTHELRKNEKRKELRKLRRSACRASA